MLSPTQSKAPLARIQPVKQELPSLDQMRADMLAIENDKREAPMTRLLAGSQRTIIDQIVVGQRMMAQSVQKYVDGKVGALAGEVNAAFASLTEQPQSETEATPEPPQTPEPVAAELLSHEPQSVAPTPTPSPNAPQITVTPVVRTSGRAQRQTAAKGGSK